MLIATQHTTKTKTKTQTRFTNNTLSLSTVVELYIDNTTKFNHLLQNMQQSATIEKSSLEWNNHAVLLLEMGLRQEAKVLLQKALQTLGDSLDRHEQEKDHQHYRSSSSSELSNANHRTTLNSVAAAAAPAKYAFAGWSSAVLLPDDDNTGMFVYSRALYIHPLFQHNLFDLYSAAILFNLGLVHHILALKGTSSDSAASSSSTLSRSTIEHYTQSSSFYEYAMKNIALINRDDENRNNKEHNLLKALLYNNLGHIFYVDSTESKVAIHYFTVASGFLTSHSSNDDSSDQHTPASLHETDVVSMLRNGLVFTLSINAAACA